MFVVHYTTRQELLPASTHPPGLVYDRFTFPPSPPLPSSPLPSSLLRASYSSLWRGSPPWHTMLQRSFEEFTGKPQRKVGGGLGRNHTFEFFAKNSCRWTMSKDQRTRERRMKNLPPFNPKGPNGLYDSLKAELGRSDRTVRLRGGGYSNLPVHKQEPATPLPEHRPPPRSLGTCPGHRESVRRRHGTVHFRHELGAVLPSGRICSATRVKTPAPWPCP